MNKHQPMAKTVSAPALHLAGRPRLRVLGTAISLLEELRLRAQTDLGMQEIDRPLTRRPVAMQPPGAAVEQRGRGCFGRC